MGQVYKISNTFVISHYAEDREPPMERRRSKIPANGQVKCHEAWLGMLDTRQEENYVPCILMFVALQ
jgi:hypothetical protein